MIEIYDLFKAAEFDKYPVSSVVGTANDSLNTLVLSISYGETTHEIFYNGALNPPDEWVKYKEIGYLYNSILDNYIKCTEEYKGCEQMV